MTDVGSLTKLPILDQECHEELEDLRRHRGLDIERTRAILHCRERQLLAKMSLISTLELTLSNATRVGVVKGERITHLEEVINGYRLDHKTECGCNRICSTAVGDVIRDVRCPICIAADKLISPAPPPEPIPEEK